MRVVFLSPFKPAKDGVGRYTENLLEGFKSGQLDLDIKVVKWNYLNKWQRIISPLFQISPLAKKISEFDIIHIQYVASLYLWYLRPILTKARHLNPELKIVMTLHETNDNTNPKLFFDWLETMNFKMADRVIVHSSYHKDLLPRLVLSKVEVISLALPQVGDNHIKKISHSILLPGFINRWKGCDLAIKAINELVPTYSDIHLSIVGRAHDKGHFNELLGLLKKFGLESHITIQSNFVSDQAFDNYFASHSLVLLPYTRITMSAILAQAIAHNATTVMSDLKPLCEYTDNRGLYFKNGDYKDLVRVIKEVWDSSELVEQNQVLFLHLQNKYNRKKIAQKTYELYKTI